MRQATLFLCIRFAFSWNIPLPGGGKVSYSGGVLRIQTDRIDAPPFPAPDTFPLPETISSIRVQDTGTVKGYGAYCTRPLEKGTFLGFYPNDRIVTDLKDCANDDYIMSLDGGATFLDGYDRAQDRTTFSPVHLNHADKGSSGCNCLRLLQDEQVAFFTSRAVATGEELCFDYGANYWNGREEQRI